MAWFEGTHTDTRQLDVPADRAAAHFADPKAILGATKGVESSTVEGGTIQFVLEEEDHGVVKFKGAYTCTYERVNDTTVRWSTSEGNLKQSGEATFTETDTGCTLEYSEKVELDLAIPDMMAPMARPVVGPMLAAEIKGFLDRMLSTLD